MHLQGQLLSGMMNKIEFCSFSYKDETIPHVSSKYFQLGIVFRILFYIFSPAETMS